MSELTGPILRAIEAEREHQDEENGPAHDDEHVFGELAIAAGAMLLYGTDYKITPESDLAWGFDRKYRDNRERQLLIAAAWCVAELERVLREKQRGAVLPALERRFKRRKGGGA